MTRLENWILVNRTDLYGNNYQKLIGNMYGHSMQNEDTGELSLMLSLIHSME